MKQCRLAAGAGGGAVPVEARIREELGLRRGGAQEISMAITAKNAKFAKIKWIKFILNNLLICGAPKKTKQQQNTDLTDDTDSHG